MTGQNRSAGYCIHCQRGVTIIKPTGDGFFGRVRTALTDNEDTWVCSKCGNPATKGFTPPADTSATESTTTPQSTENQAAVADNPSVTPDPDTQLRIESNFDIDLEKTRAATPDLTENANPTESSNPEAFTVPNSNPEAVCHLCRHTIPFKPENICSAITCPGCQATVHLPRPQSESLLTSSPAIIKLDDDPERPAISKSLCTLCQFEMTYPKKLTGKEVDCPSCSTHFQLP